MSRLVRGGKVAAEQEHHAALVEAELRVPQRPGILQVEVGLVSRSAAVERVQIEPRRTEVVQGVRIVLPLQAGGGVEGDVVVDELAEVGVAVSYTHLTLP